MSFEKVNEAIGLYEKHNQLLRDESKIKSIKKSLTPMGCNLVSIATRKKGAEDAKSTSISSSALLSMIELSQDSEATAQIRFNCLKEIAN